MRRVEVAPTFERDIKRLARRYHYIRQDIELLIEELKTGGLPGDRVIYYLPRAELTILLTAYSKADQSDIPAREIVRILDEELS